MEKGNSFHLESERNELARTRVRPFSVARFQEGIG